ncbi:MAG: helix-turn-helix domain-containing protein [Bacteroidetes bacterium]|nr:helix-turn-helix domain-containing protein [Bacteroidota bacterium]MBS1670016.1 helix-turn-helix domain-containing protein [Bacteroidota bacterium]
MINITPFDKAIDLHKPKRLKKYVLIWCLSGSATVVIDENEFLLKTNTLTTITIGQIHYFKDLKAVKGFILEFTYDFFCKDDNDIELIFHNSLFCHFGMNEVISMGKNKSFEIALTQLEKELKQKPYQYLIVVHSIIKLMLVEINRSKIAQGYKIWKPDALFLKFLEIVRANFKKNLTLKQYASLLNTTESKLNEHSKLHTGKTAKNVIHGLLASEAKRFLMYEKLSVKEVAYELGFSDPFYFSNFFKKITNQSPKAYKENYSF